MTTLTKQRKLKRLADRRMMRRFIERIHGVGPGMFLGDIEGHNARYSGAPLLTNFRYTSLNVRSYVLAAKRYTKIDPSVRFGMSDHTITVDEDEGFVAELHGHGGFFLCSSRRYGLDSLWRIFDRIRKERTHNLNQELTRRMRQIRLQRKMTATAAVK